MITIKSQFSFFDVPKVRRSVDRMKIRAMAKMGGYVRTTARRSIRKKKGSSLPGKPPASHTGDLKKIFFGYDKGRDSAVIGPLKFKNSTAPRDLEHGGGTVTVYKKNAKGKLVRKEVPLKARPFMDPALRITAPKFPGVFTGKLRV